MMIIVILSKRCVFLYKNQGWEKGRISTNIFWLNTSGLTYLQTTSNAVAFLWYLYFLKKINVCLVILSTWTDCWHSAPKLKLKAYLLRTVSFMITNRVLKQETRATTTSFSKHQKKINLKQWRARFCIKIKSLCSLRGRANLKWTAIFSPWLIYPHFTEASNLETWHNCMYQQGICQLNALDACLMGSQLFWSLAVQWKVIFRSLENLWFRAYLFLW